MANPNAAPSADPFEQLDSDAPLASAKPKKADPFEALDSDQPMAPPQTSSAVGAFARGAERSFLPAIGSFPAIGAGAEVGTALGAFGGPLAPITVPIGGLVGGGLAAFGGSYLLGKAQDWALSKLPDSWKETLGLDDRQEKLDAGEHPVASFLGGIAPYALTMRPGAVPKTVLPENATALQRILSHPATARLFGGAAMGGMELGQEAAEGQDIDWRKGAIATGFGLVFNRPTRIGEALTEIGARPARVALGRPSPTVAQAADAKVMGPGVTENVFQGAHEQDPAAESTAQAHARAEQATIGEPPRPDVHAAARQMHPELFAHYDDLLARRDALRDWIAEQGPEAAPAAVKHLDDVNTEIATVGLEIAPAYRRAAEAAGAPTLPAGEKRFATMAEMLAAQGEEGVPARPGAPAEAAPPKPIADQRAAIAADAERQFVNAGEPQERAELLAKLTAERYVQVAQRFNGALGTAEEIYHREGPAIKGAAAPGTPAAPVGAPQLPGGTLARIDHSHDVVSGANSSKVPNGPIYIDKRIPQESPTLKTRDGQPANLWKYLGVHEDDEAKGMREGLTYDRAHIRATEAERAAVEADGVDWNAYTHEIDGYLAKIEHETVQNPPSETHVNPQEAIGHHRAENKPPLEEALQKVSSKRGPASRNPDTFSLLEFLAANGGIRNDDALISDLKQSFGGQNKFLPGFGQLIRNPAALSTAAAAGGRKAPMTLDKAREAAVAAGYLPEVPEGVEQTNVGTLLDAIDHEARGDKVYRTGYQPEGRPAEEGEIEKARHDFMGGLDDYVKENGGAPLTEREVARAFELWNKEGINAASEILERLALEADDKEIEGGGTVRAEPIPGWDIAHEPAGAPGEGARVAEAQPAEPGGGPARIGGERAGGKEDPQRLWQQFLDTREGRVEHVRIATGYNEFSTRQGSEIRGKRSQEWSPGNVVDVGFVKDLLIAKRNGDGTFTLVAKPNVMGISKSYSAAPHGGLVSAKPVDFLQATTKLREPEEALEYFQRRKPAAEIPPSPEYQDALKAHAVAFQEFSKAQQDYRARTNPNFDEATKEFLAARAKYDEATKAFDEAYSREGARKAEGPSLTAQREAEGQLGLPGTERISDAELAQKKANEPLKPTVEQQMMDIGLFGTEKDQKELFQRKPSNNPELEAAIDAKDWRKIVEIQRELEGMRAAMRDPETGKVYTGWSHQAAIESVPKGEGDVWARLHSEWDRATSNAGFVDRNGNFISRDEADRRWKILTMEDLRDQKQFFQGAQGKVRIREGAKPVITLFESRDASTAIHELGHVWLEEMMRHSEHEAAPEALKTDAHTIKDWLGVETSDAIKTRHHEKFAKGFEQYLREGVAPSPELGNVFARFRDWMLRIYQSIKGLGEEITPAIREVFDRMLAMEPQRTVIAPDLAKRPTLQDIHEADARGTEPHEAEPAGDRVVAERDRFGAELPPEIASEHEASTQRTASAEGAAAEGGSAAKPAGEARPGAGGPGEVVAGGGGPGTEPAGGAGGAEHGAVEPGGGNALREGAATPAGERPESSAGLGDKPLAPRPSALLGAGESPFTDRAGNIRLENLTNIEDVRQAIRAAASENKDFIADRRGVVTDGQVMDLAADLGLEGAERLVKERVVGQAFNAEQVIALRKLLVQSATELSAAMKKAAEGTDEDVITYAVAKDRHQMIQATVAQATAEAGRALRAFRNIAGEGNAEAAQADMFARQATGKTLYQLRQEAKLGAALDTPQKISKFMQDASKRTYGRMILEYYINALISGPATHATYMVGNEILALQKAGPETAAAALIGAVRRSMGREGETVRIGEVAEQLKAHAGAVPSALHAALEAFRTGTTTALPGERDTNVLLFQPGAELAEPAMLNEAAKFSDVMTAGYGILRGIKDGFIAGGELAKAAGKEAPLIGFRQSNLGAIPDIEIKGMNLLPLGTAVRLPSRFVAAIHSFYRTMNFSMEKAADSYRMAANEGLTGTAFDARVGELRQNPSQEKMESYARTSSTLTLMGQGGAFTQQLSKLVNTPIFGFPFFKFIDPFVHISSNIINQSIIQRTPVGILSSELRADLMGRNGNIAQDTAMARMLVGTAYAVGIGSLAAEGYVSGSGPSDPKQAAIWRLAGNQAHSVRVGDIWYDVHRLGPLGMLMGVAADLYDVAHTAEQGDMLNAASHLQHAVTQNVLDESFMRGPSDLIKAVEDPGRYGEAYIRNFLSSFLPYSVGMAQMARASDPYSRQARSVMDAIKTKVPGLSETLLPRRDIWGEPMANRDALLAAGVTAIYETRMSRDPVNLALLDLGIAPAQVTRKIRNVQLTDDQYDDFQRIAGRMAKMRLDAIVNSPDYRSWPNHVRHDVISEVITQSREAARGIMMAKFPQIVRDATQARLKKLQD